MVLEKGRQGGQDNLQAVPDPVTGIATTGSAPNMFSQLAPGCLRRIGKGLGKVNQIDISKGNSPDDKLSIHEGRASAPLRQIARTRDVSGR